MERKDIKTQEVHEILLGNVKVVFTSYIEAAEKQIIETGSTLKSKQELFVNKSRNSMCACKAMFRKKALQVEQLGKGRGQQEA